MRWRRCCKATRTHSGCAAWRRDQTTTCCIDVTRPRLPAAFTLFLGVAHHRDRYFKILAVFLAHLLGEFIPLFRRDGPWRNRRLASSRPAFICSPAMKINPPRMVGAGG